MLKKLFSSRKFWSIVGAVGTGATVIGTIFTYVAEPKTAEADYREIAQEEVKKALEASNKES